MQHTACLFMATFSGSKILGSSLATLLCGAVFSQAQNGLKNKKRFAVTP